MALGGTSYLGIKLVVDTKQAKALQADMAKTYAIINAGAAAAQTALTLVGSAFIAMGAGAFVALGAAQQFQHEMTTLRALSGVSVQEMNALAKSINEVSVAFGVSGDEIAAGAVTLSKAGLSVDEINQSIESMTMLSRANGIAFDQAAEITVFAVETFGKAFSDAGEMMDAMQVAAQESILNIEDLQKGFAYAGSTAMMTGVSFEQLLALMATLSNRALEAGISSRSLNKMFIDMLEHTDELNQFMSSMGMTFEIIKDGKLDIDSLIAAFSDQALTLDILMQANDIFTVRALRAFGLLIGASDDYANMLTQVTNSSGALAGVAETMMDSFVIKFGKLKQEFVALLRTEEVIEVLTQMVDRLVDMLQEIKPDVIALITTSLNDFVRALSEEQLLGVLTTVIDLIGFFYKALIALNDVLQVGDGVVVKIALSIVVLNMVAGTMIRTTLALTTANAGMVSSMALLNTVMKAGILGVLLLTQAEDPWIKFLGLVTIAYAALTAATWANTAANIANHQSRVVMATTQVGTAMVPGMLGGGQTKLTQLGKYSKPIMSKAVPVGTTAPVTGWRAMMGMRGLMVGGGLVGLGALLLGAAVSDTGTFYNNMRSARSIYDTGGLAPRHQMAFIEPGEQIVSKTQGMVGMGQGITVNVGDVYAQDGTDFAEKLAEALPRALRRTSYGGGF